MLCFREYFLAEQTYSKLQQDLIHLGYTDFKKISGNRIAVLTDENRMDVMETIKASLSHANPKMVPLKGHSLGAILVYDKLYILVKPKSRQGKASAGIQNEEAIVNIVNEFATKEAPIDVVFVGKNKKKIRMFNVSSAEMVGGDTSDRKKADIVLKGDKNYPISIKKENAEYWESADSFWSQKAKAIVDDLIKKGEVKLSNHEKIPDIMKITPNIAVKANATESSDVVFGSDILPNGAVITKNFRSTSYRFDGENETLYISADHVITSLRDVRGSKEVYFLIRNDSSRSGSKIYPGLRVLATYKSRINRNVKVV